MPELKAGFDFDQFDTALFDAVPGTAAFATKIAAEFNEPIFRFVYDGTIYDDFVMDAPIISRGGDIVAGAATITLSNTPRARIDGVGIAFVDSDPDTITDSGSGFVTAGFQAGDKITVSGSTSNDGTYTVVTVAAGTLTLNASDSLSVEGASALVTILSEPVFNFFIADRINSLGKPCHLGFYFDGTLGYLYLMTGTVEEVSYNGATITLSIRDKMAPMLENRIGSGQAPADYYTQRDPFNPATIVFNILTAWGGLDSTFSTDNIDINFTSWQAWFDRCTAHSYEVRARFPGMTIQNALLRIGDLTNSFIWVDAEGFFQFTMFEPPYVAGAGDETFDLDNSIDIDIDIDKSTVRNVMNIYYGHDPDANYNPKSIIGSRGIGFANDNPDRIFLNLAGFAAQGGFLVQGFNTDDPVTISGSNKNDGKYAVQSVAGRVITLTASNGLTDEDSGASVTLTQNRDTSTIQTTSLVFNDTGSNDTITDVTESFVVLGIDANDSITISGSLSNDGTYGVESVTPNTITLDIAETLTQEASGELVVLTQTHSVTLTATTIAFNDDEREAGIQPEPRRGDRAQVDHINKSDGNFLTTGFVPQFPVTVSGSVSNDGTYNLANVTSVQMDLLNQTLADENPGPGDDDVFVTVTQEHTLASSGKQFEALLTDIDDESVALYGTRVLTDEDKLVWHDNQKSAANAADEKLKIYKFPAEVARIDATMIAFLSDIGDEIHVTEAHKNITDQTYFIKNVDIDIEEGRAEIKAERGN